jgi:ADP-ribose pyrophosphatase YjhB (NUDIX family)
MKNRRKKKKRNRGGLRMKGKKIVCPKCGTEVIRHINPVPTVDIIIEIDSEAKGRGIVLIFRKQEPRAWALPGGFVEYGETLEQAAVREAKEETDVDLEVKSIAQFHTYSDPERDPRQHTISTIFIAQAKGRPRPGDDAERVGVFTEANLPPSLAFDHGKILREYFFARKTLSAENAEIAEKKC